jgi:hypothetical protein
MMIVENLEVLFTWVFPCRDPFHRAFHQLVACRSLTLGS